MPKRQISITMDSELLDIIDRIVGMTGHNRSEIIEFFIRRGLREYEEYSRQLSISKRKQYDIMDRIIDEVLRNTIKGGSGK